MNFSQITNKVIGYIRVSNEKQTLENQKLAILDYAHKNQLLIQKFTQIIISSRRTIAERKILETLSDLSSGDSLVVTELSRLGRSTVEVLALVQEIIEQGIILILIKENLKLDKHNHQDLVNTVMLTVFSMLANLERNLISQRTKEGLAARKSRGVQLGKPKGTIQRSIYDAKLDIIKECLAKRMNIPNISK